MVIKKSMILCDASKNPCLYPSISDEVGFNIKTMVEKSEDGSVKLID